MTAGAPSLAGLRRSRGPDARRVDRVLEALETGGTVTELVCATGCARRTVEDVLAALGDKVADDGGRWHLAGDTDAAGLACAVPGSGVDDAAILAALTDAAADRPAPRRALDHVAATLPTLVARARHLAGRYALESSALVMLGDHDLTSLAVGLLSPATPITVVDLDPRVLAHLRRAAGRLGITLTTHPADLREPLPAEVAGTADLVFTDPPYSASGVGLFLARGIECLRDHATGRVLLCYGFGEDHPALGRKVQATFNDLRLVVEAQLPDFNRYNGAEAIGSRSDLYALRPTRRSPAAAARVAARAGRAIYTHGPEAAESGS